MSAGAVSRIGEERRSERQVLGRFALRPIGKFDQPVYVDAAPSQPRLLFVVELGGTVRVVRRGAILERPFVDLSHLVESGGERGLLSIAVHPRYRRNRTFYVAYVNHRNDIEVDRLRTSRENRLEADLNSRREVIVVKHPDDEYHYGGQLEFGSDGFLYLSTGDGAPGDVFDHAQNPSSLLGKLLRIRPLRRGGYRIPRSNPFAGRPIGSEVYALGFRNPSRFSFDGADLWIADVGQDAWEEVNEVSLTAARGANFGWSLYEGNHPYKAGPFDPPPPHYRPPLYEYSSLGGSCAVIGGYVVRDPHLPALFGRYVFADFCDGDLRYLEPASGLLPTRAISVGLNVANPTSFGTGRNGRLYVASLAGPVFQLVPGG